MPAFRPIRLGLLMLFALMGAALAEDARTIELRGAVIRAGTLTLDDIKAFPPIEQEVRFQTSKGEEHATYKGALLWTVLEAKGIKGDGHHDELRLTFTVEGRDGYRIAFSVGEIVPDFGNVPVLVAFERDGQPVIEAEGFRLIVPGDKRGARYVKDVVAIDIR